MKGNFLPRIYAERRGLKLLGKKSAKSACIGGNAPWEWQPLNYLRAAEVEAGVLLNFGPKLQFQRYVFDNDRKNQQNPSESAERKLIF
jgi:hypothetical protein